MKNIAPGVWKDQVEGVDVIVNENLNFISTVLPGNKEVKVSYNHVPTTDDFNSFRAGVEEAVWVLNRLNIR